MTTTTKKRATKVVSAPIAASQRDGGRSMSFDSDEVIEAYLVGKKDGFNHGMGEAQRATAELLKNNVTKVATYIIDVLDFLTQRGFTPKDAYLKIIYYDELSVMVLVDEQDFLNPAFKEVYDIVSFIEDPNENDTLGTLVVEFSFAPYSNSFNLACLDSDGFTLKLKADTDPVTK